MWFAEHGFQEKKYSELHIMRMSLYPAKEDLKGGAKMKKAVFLLFVLVGAGVVIASDAVLPVYFPGEHWTYDAKEGRDVGTGSSRSGFASGSYKMSISSDGKMDIDPSFRYALPSLYDPTSEVKWFSFPLKVGAEWEIRWQRSSRKWSSGTVKVMGTETVSVPAGTFETFKLVLDEGWRLTEYWYSPQAKAVVHLFQKQYRRDGSVSVSREVKLASYSVRN